MERERKQGAEEGDGWKRCLVKSFGRLSDLGRKVVKFLGVYGYLGECAQVFGRAGGSSWRMLWPSLRALGAE